MYSCESYLREAINKVIKASFSRFLHLGSIASQPVSYVSYHLRQSDMAPYSCYNQQSTTLSSGFKSGDTAAIEVVATPMVSSWAYLGYSLFLD